MYKLSLNLSLLLLLTSASIASLKAANSSINPESEEQQTILPSSETLTEDGWRNWDWKSLGASCAAGGLAGGALGFNPSISIKTAGTAGVALAAGAGNHIFFKNYKNDAAFVGCGLGTMLLALRLKSVRQEEKLTDITPSEAISASSSQSEGPSRSQCKHMFSSWDKKTMASCVYVQHCLGTLSGENLQIFEEERGLRLAQLTLEETR